jgi:hypothetical protein
VSGLQLAQWRALLLISAEIPGTSAAVIAALLSWAAVSFTLGTKEHLLNLQES